jgi:superfamily I DNA/RNA helicase
MNKALHPKQVEYIRSCLRNNQKLTDEPRITISTIHKVKGGEATNVAIVPDYSYLSAQYIDSDDEHRIQYVAVTRAKKNLFLISPETEYFYEY